MIAKRAYRPDKPVAQRVTEITVNGSHLRAGQNVTLWPGAGRKQCQRFQFEWATTDPGGHLVLEVYGPLGRRRPPGYRCIAPSEIKVVHRK